MTTAIQLNRKCRKWVSEQVSEAHRPKNQRLKQAREAAQAEIEQYHLQREKEFKALEDAVWDPWAAAARKWRRRPRRRWPSSGPPSSRTGMKSCITSWPLSLTPGQKCMKITASMGRRGRSSSVLGLAF
ncbi:unnamed protein product [Gulo gulo]|uniref:V-type proton ATPase subunit G n=1 Tax=Gulo gulo TaxID=48420 RepID=A0A9X9LWW7_GULGU|nr:unnamed protein product [Gulo gulo]